MNSEKYHEFSAAIAGADSDVDLFGAAMMVAGVGGHDVDPHRSALQLDLMAEAVREQAGDNAGVDALAHAVDHQLFSVQGFRGNTEDYSDPSNSYLDHVIDRRLGIPITLSLVYMEVAERVGLFCEGVGYPGHFIVRCGGSENPIYVDPFQQGCRLDRAELLAGLSSLNLGGASPTSFLSAVTRRQLLQRLLNNLHVIFRERRDLERWFDVIQLLLRIEPWNATLVGERGMLNYRLGNLEQAMNDLERYVSAEESREPNPGAVRLLDELRLRYGGREELR